MSKKALYLLGIALTIILGTFLYVKFCCNCSMQTPAADTEKVPTVAVKDNNFVPFVLNGPGINFRTNDNLKFLKNSAALIVPVSDSVTIGVDNLKTFLIANPKQKVTITGYATSDETNTTKFENLGLARANDVKNYFVSKGLSAAQFDTKGEIIASWKTNLDTLLGPAEYKFEAIDTTAVATDEWSILKDKINTDPLILHFNTNKSSDNLTAIEKQKVADIAKYMDHVKDASVLIVGHTDDVGNRDANVILGQKRAEFSKNYLAKNGIDASRITTESKGPDEPVGENTTVEGKANNRRTVITIK
ncbi:outer membrane protein OmpA-like peptidoglycan-associated protein [Flavobacterium cutihirudinis]|uniref:Outer membrane protein OmpA-like peptidoglycan-associated protein n=1 Tax=Flavobacterium cutihirudinis TaxID=1265740 RepID=A0A3D9G1T2_9FLAO|nr:OmpA family protein [Flavobacterium cutihirudinis]RED27149.1 outer membrane protein OmpA-like peptidoglycan-associated protein [Flavobacterium cutihirudinis]